MKVSGGRFPARGDDKGSSSARGIVPVGPSVRRGDAEVSWLGVVAGGAFPATPGGVGPVAVAAGSPLTVAGAAPVLHRTSLSHRGATLARRRAARHLRRRQHPPAFL